MPGTKAVFRPDLGALAFEYSMQAASMGFIAPLVLPPFYTPLKTAQYPVIPAEALLDVVDTERAPRSAYARGDWEFGSDDYNCSENGYEEMVDDAEARLYRNYFDAELLATYRAISIILRKMEIRCAAKVFNANTFAGHAVAHAWNSYADADPRADVIAGIEAMRMSTGIEPNALILDKSVLRHVSMCDSVIERVKYSNPDAIRGDLTEAQLKAYFGVEKIIAAGAVKNNAPKKKTKNVQTVWSPAMAMLGVVSDGGQDLKEPSIGRTFVWEEDSPEMLVVETYREEQTRSDIVRARQHTDECIQFTGAGYLMTGVTA
ncbi:hypothetical protein NNJEOMEG_03317 [Fundidesulfovibrio magnetotacticus]|uniref:Phage major capsid protein E n=1 Tax=Fundidesulfovibrio magnetotacticus TaxID=2730080 RepID=A0A6V8LUP0_9BACT|nr:hypothetical protein [Fundidesulfovibrio magnetotacticus]GFK95454.1 hypothetical protein NNJEOMEG_03317 [Fundidesulfovibrio magnetotacticus]